MPAISEAIIKGVSELLMITESSKARSVIKIDIVKPLPPKKPASTMFFHFKYEGITQRPKPIPLNEKSQTLKVLQLQVW